MNCVRKGVTPSFINTQFSLVLAFPRFCNGFFIFFIFFCAVIIFRKTRCAYSYFLMLSSIPCIIHIESLTFLFVLLGLTSDDDDKERFYISRTYIPGHFDSCSYFYIGIALLLFNCLIIRCSYY